jgi:PTS system nitrogen regulatory IIA component
MHVLENFSLGVENVVFLEDCTPIEAIVTLVQSLKNSIDGRVVEVIDKVMERERIVPTAIGLSIAIPHARCSFLDYFSIAIGVCKKEGIEWGGVDDHPVKIICLIAGPENKPREYLSFLSFITTLLREEEVRLQILNESDKKSIVNIFATC